MTLVELSVVILVLSMLLSMMFGVYYTAADLSRRIIPESERQTEAMQALELMRKSLNNAFYASDVKRLVFISRKKIVDGQRRDQITFASFRPGAEAVGSAAVREVSFYVAVRDEEANLMIREDSDVDDKPVEGGNHYPLVKRVRSLEFRYTIDGKEWSDDWNSVRVKRIPRLIQIRLTILSGEERVSTFETVSSPGVYFK